jgi:hypothetical protein
MTIWAQHPEIFQAMVVLDPVAVVDLDGDGTTPPFFNPAFVATIFQDAGSQKAPLHTEPRL